MKNNTVKLSKFLSLVLRHKPDKIGLSLDENGWAEVSELIECSENCGTQLSHELIGYIVENNNKKRFELSEDGKRIRASQGHSIPVDLNLNSIEPPELLYHGTVGRFLSSIYKNGITKQSRNHVHLSVDRRTAINVGGRRGEPIILEIKAREMFDNGHKFYLSKNGVWLTDIVPPEFIQGVNNG